MKTILNRTPLMALLLQIATLAANAQSITAPEPCGPTPNVNQLALQNMEEYAFLHYSLNTYTDMEWGYGNENPAVFNPTKLDVRQWARTCKAAGMKGIILTAKHHCGFCLWPSEYTEYSIKNSPWKNGKGDIVGDLAKACHEYGLKFAVYLSPWDRNHAGYGKPEYVTYFRNQLRELLTNYGDIFEVWFDGANGGNGYYGGTNETRMIDRTTYYQWPETYRMIRQLQPKAVIWNDGGERGDLRWVGTEAGNVGETNWSLLNKTGDVPWEQLHYGLENGNAWVPGETNTSIRPGWFYHKSEDDHVKSLSKLMDTYYKSVGRNSTLLLNFPIDRDGLINPIDSARGIAFARMVEQVFSNNLAQRAKVSASNVRGNSRTYSAANVIDKSMQTYWAADDGVTKATLTIRFNKPTRFNRFMAQEFIQLGQRVRKFSLKALVGSKWVSLKDELVDNGDGLTTIGRKRIICFPTIKATQLKFIIEDSKKCPLISNIGVYLAPELSMDIPNSGEKFASKFNVTIVGSNDVPGKSILVDMEQSKMVSGFRYLPPQNTRNGIITHYSLWTSENGNDWTKVCSGEFPNVVNNPIWQNLTFKATKARFIRLDGEQISEGDRVLYSDIDVNINK